jgi:hypothetical protein
VTHLLSRMHKPRAAPVLLLLLLQCLLWALRWAGSASAVLASLLLGSCAGRRQRFARQAAGLQLQEDPAVREHALI